MGNIILTVSLKCSEVCERQSIENCTECLISSIPRKFEIFTYLKESPVKVTTLEAQRALEEALQEIMNELQQDKISEEVINKLNKDKKLNRNKNNLNKK